MNLLTTQYVHDKQRLEIYLAGCKGVNGVHCKGCHNPQSWSFNAGEEITVEIKKRLMSKIKETLVKNVWILGGEPLDTSIAELKQLTNYLKTSGKPIWLFTRYELAEVPEYIRGDFTYIKTGAYVEDFPTKEIPSIGLTLGSSNQKIFKKEFDKWVEL